MQADDDGKKKERKRKKGKQSPHIRVVMRYASQKF